MASTEALRAYKAEWYLKNKERLSLAARERYLRNRESILLEKKSRYPFEREKLIAKEKVRWASLPIEQKKKRMALSAARDKNFPEQARARTSLRRKRSQQATPPWLSKSQKIEIKNLYLLAQHYTKISMCTHHVDHIVPLHHPLVCGLHVPWNLQILFAQLNVAKSNNNWPDMPQL